MEEVKKLKAFIIELAKKNSLYSQRSGDDDKLDKFLNLFPKFNLDKLNLEQYVLGEGSINDNFCRWIERELQSAIGRYMPGTARGHMIYRMRDGGGLYKLKSLESYSDTEALQYMTGPRYCYQFE